MHPCFYQHCERPASWHLAFEIQHCGLDSPQKAILFTRITICSAHRSFDIDKMLPSPFWPHIERAFAKLSHHIPPRESTRIKYLPLSLPPPTTGEPH